MAANKKISSTQALVESAILIAIGTVLSLIKIVDLPYGGSVTVASMLPVVIIAYRHGLGLGLTSGLVFGVIQQLLGLNTLSWVTGWQSVVAVIVLDYVVAFGVLGLGGVFRRRFEEQAPGLVLGTLLVCALRYLCHVVSGATVWAGLSIPTKDALLYSLAYNATYMLPETLVTLVSAYYVGSALDFRTASPVRLKGQTKNAGFLLRLIGGLLLSAALIFDAAAVFSKLQNAETGEWDLSGLGNVAWIAVAVVSCVGLVAFAACFLAARKKDRAQAQTN